MVNVDKAVIARFKKNGKEFEILVDCDKALELRSGKSISIDDIIATDDIYRDVRKAEKAREKDLKDVFHTIDFREISRHIIMNGEVQLTRDHLTRVREEKRKQIIAIIHRHAVDPKTGLPHPPQRIASAMDEARIHIDEHKGAEMQVEDVLKKIRTIIPISFQTKKLEVMIPARFAGQCFHVLKSYGEHKNDWLDDGSLRVEISLPAGIVDEFFGKLNAICHGEVESREI